MAGKMLMISVVVLAVFAAQGDSLTDTRLEDRHLTHITNSHLGSTISIPKNFWDTLSTCHVIFPNGVMYEVFPQYQIPQPNVFFLQSVQPFLSCGIGFRDVDTSFSGTYELLSVVLSSSDSSLTLTRQRFHITVRNPTS